MGTGNDMKIEAVGGDIWFDDENLHTTGTLDAGLTTLSGNLIIPDLGYIGSVSDTDAIQIEADGDIVMSQDLAVTGILTAASFIGTANPTIISSANAIDIKPSGDADDFLRLTTVSGISYITIMGGECYKASSRNSRQCWHNLF